MTSLRSAWSDAWAKLPEDVHDVMTKEKDGLRLPSDRAVRGFFARAFADALPSSMRTRAKVYGSTKVGPREVEQIDQAVQSLAPRLIRTASFLRTFERLGTQERLSVGDKREALLSFAFDKAGEHTNLDDDAANMLLDEFLAIPRPSALTQLLNDDTLAAKLEAELATRSLPAPEPFGEEFSAARSTLEAFLNDKHLPYSNIDADVDTHPDTAERWAAVRDVDVARWHQLAGQVGLTVLSEPALPPVREPREDDPGSPETSVYVDHWLDSSLERRLRGALDVKRDLRLGLPDERTLLDLELDRAVAPLGLTDHDSRLLIALGIALVINLDKKQAGTRASATVAYRFAQWRAINEKLAGQAAIPDLVVNLVEDPTEWYIATLWRRAHGHDVRGTVAHSPHEVWRTLIGIGATASRRLGELSRRLSNELRRKAPNSVGERVEAVVHYALSTGVDPVDLYDFCWTADPARAADAAQWNAWATGARERVTLTQLVEWREQNRPE